MRCGCHCHGVGVAASDQTKRDGVVVAKILTLLGVFIHGLVLGPFKFNNTLCRWSFLLMSWVCFFVKFKSILENLSHLINALVC